MRKSSGKCKTFEAFYVSADIACPVYWILRLLYLNPTFDSIPHEITILCRCYRRKHYFVLPNLPQRIILQKAPLQPAVVLAHCQPFMPRQFKHSSKILPRDLHELLQRHEMRAICQRYQSRHGWNRNHPIGC